MSDDWLLINPCSDDSGSEASDTEILGGFDLLDGSEASSSLGDSVAGSLHVDESEPSIEEPSMLVQQKATAPLPVPAFLEKATFFQESVWRLHTLKAQTAALQDLAFGPFSDAAAAAAKSSSLPSPSPSPSAKPIDTLSWHQLFPFGQLIELSNEVSSHINSSFDILTELHSDAKFESIVGSTNQRQRGKVSQEVEIKEKTYKSALKSFRNFILAYISEKAEYRIRLKNSIGSVYLKLRPNASYEEIQRAIASKDYGMGIAVEDPATGFVVLDDMDPVDELDYNVINVFPIRKIKCTLHRVAVLKSELGQVEELLKCLRKVYELLENEPSFERWLVLLERWPKMKTTLLGDLGLGRTTVVGVTEGEDEEKRLSGA